MRPDCHIPARGARWSVIVHGGFMAAARRADETAVAESRAALLESVRRAGAILDRGGDGCDAVEAALIILEDCPQFDAGRGSALTATGGVELDAAIMRGADLGAGAVAGVTRVRNPIRAARAVLEHTPHVLLQGAGADAFAMARGLEQAGPDWFVIPRMQAELAAARQRTGAAEMGTVGCVVRDARGEITAGTSTGGTTNKLPGRVGDSPLVGAGTWADSRWCGVSCTGEGEFFVRVAAARTVCACMELAHLSLAGAMNDVIHGRIPALGGRGGAIAVDNTGNISAVANVPGMVFAGCTSNGVVINAFDAPERSTEDAGIR